MSSESTSGDSSSSGSSSGGSSSKSHTRSLGRMEGVAVDSPNRRSDELMPADVAAGGGDPSPDQVAEGTEMMWRFWRKAKRPRPLAQRSLV